MARRSRTMSGLDEGDIIAIDDSESSDDEPHRVTRQRLNGRSDASYDMKSHPMDPFTRPKRAKNRSTAQRRDQSDEEDQLNDADTDSYTDDEASFRRPRETTPERSSSRIACQKPVQYSAKIHPQDKELAAAGVRRLSTHFVKKMDAKRMTSKRKRRTSSPLPEPKVRATKTSVSKEAAPKRSGKPNKIRRRSDSCTLSGSVESESSDGSDDDIPHRYMSEELPLGSNSEHQPLVLDDSEGFGLPDLVRESDEDVSEPSAPDTSLSEEDHSVTAKDSPPYFHGSGTHRTLTDIATEAGPMTSMRVREMRSKATETHNKQLPSPESEDQQAEPRGSAVTYTHPFVEDDPCESQLMPKSRLTTCSLMSRTLAQDAVVNGVHFSELELRNMHPSSGLTAFPAFTSPNLQQTPANTELIQFRERLAGHARENQRQNSLARSAENMKPAPTGGDISWVMQDIHSHSQPPPISAGWQNDYDIESQIEDEITSLSQF